MDSWAKQNMKGKEKKQNRRRCKGEEEEEEEKGEEGVQDLNLGSLRS